MATNRRQFLKQLIAAAGTTATAPTAKAFNLFGGPRNAPPTGIPEQIPLQYDLIDQGGAGINFFAPTLDGKPATIVITDTNTGNPISFVNAGLNVEVHEITDEGHFISALFDRSDLHYNMAEIWRIDSQYRALTNGKLTWHDGSPEVGHAQQTAARALDQWAQYQQTRYHVVSPLPNADRPLLTFIDPQLAPGQYRVKASVTGFGRGVVEVTHGDYVTRVDFGAQNDNELESDFARNKVTVTTTFFRRDINQAVVFPVDLRTGADLCIAMSVDRLMQNINDNLRAFDYLSFDNKTRAAMEITRAIINDVMIAISAINGVDYFGQKIYPKVEGNLPPSGITLEDVFGKGPVGAARPLNNAASGNPSAPHFSVTPPPQSPMAPPAASSMPMDSSASLPDAAVKCNDFVGSGITTHTATVPGGSLGFTMRPTQTIVGGVLNGQEVNMLVKGGQITNLNGTPADPTRSAMVRAVIDKLRKTCGL